MRVFLLMCFCLSVIPAYAFEPQKHAEFSSDAIALYKACTGKFVPGKVAQAFAEGAEDEDNPTPTRGRNWHFYNNGGKIGHYWRLVFFRCNGSNEEIFKKRVEKLQKLIEEKASTEDIYAAAGRVAHHIQDMSSPPHVLPIYHTDEDRFDKYEPATVPNLATNAICNSLQGNIVTPNELLESAAQATLAAVAAPVVFSGGEKIESETWAKFWGGGSDKKYKGFSIYGAYGNTYGVRILNADSANRAKYDQTIFDNFFNERRNRAVIDTVQLLRYVDKLELKIRTN